MASIIKVQNLRKVYRVGKEKVVALDDICLEIGEGEMCCIVGASGSGKSTLLNQLAGLEKPTKGRVLIGKHDISAMTEDELADFRQCCFSKRMRKDFRKNEKSMLQNCNKKAKRKGRLQRVKKPM